MSIRIIIADDHPVTRKGLSSVLSEEEDLVIIGETGDGLSTIREADNLDPDVIIMDISLPDIDGIEVTRRIKEKSPHIRIIALSIHSTKHYVIEMLKAGASGYLRKECDVKEVVKAIHFVQQDEIYLSPETSSAIARDYLSIVGKKGSSEKELLSPREYEVLKHVAKGKTTKEIADKLHISRKTVETHRTRIMQKLDIHSTAELALYALKKGLIMD